MPRTLTAEELDSLESTAIDYARAHHEYEVTDTSRAVGADGSVTLKVGHEGCSLSSINGPLTADLAEFTRQGVEEWRRKNPLAPHPPVTIIADAYYDGDHNEDLGRRSICKTTITLN